MRRVWRRVAISTAVVFTLSVAVPADAVPAEGEFPLSWLWSWAVQPPALAAARSIVGLPVQAAGAARLDPRPASAASTAGKHGAGTRPKPVAGTLESYRPYEATTPKTVTGDTDPSFDAATSKRLAAQSTARSDVFQNADGSITRRTYSRPTNFSAADGTFTPIDTDLVKRADGRLHMKANSLQVSVAAQAPQTDAPAPSPGRPSTPAPAPDPSGAPGATKAPVAKAPALKAPAAESTEDLARLTLPTGQSVGYQLDGATAATAIVADGLATYPQILPETDLELQTFDAGLKETLVLRSPQAPSSWVFPLRLDGLTPRADASGEIELLDAAGKVVVHFPKGYMIDSRIDPHSGAGAQSTNVTYRLIETADGPALRVEADQAWLRDPARVYPVRVDPTATTATTGDVYVDNDSDTGDQNGDNLPVGTYDGGKTKARSFIHLDDFDTSPAMSKRITAAKLKLFLTWAYSCDAHRAFAVHKANERWAVADLTKGKFPGPAISGAIGTLDVADTGAACKNTSSNRKVGKWVTVSLNPATFYEWARGGANYGLALTASESDSNAWKRFTSANYADGQYRPVLELTYANNVAPQINVRYPANNAVAPTLSPELLVRGYDADNFPAKGLKYTFVVYDKAGKVVANSGAIGSAGWTVPAGKLAWNTTYLWQAQPNDTLSNGAATPLWAFSTAAAQPALTGNLAQNSGKGYDVSIGNYTTSATDASIATVGPSLTITRSYNSLDTRRANAFGTGWSSFLDMRATQQLDAARSVQTLLVTYPTGQELAFGRNGDGTFTPPSGRFATLKETRSGSTVTGYTLTDKDATVYTFGRAVAGGVYRLTSVADANGRTLRVAYDTAGNATTLTGASGRALTIKWSTPSGSSAPHVTEVITDPTDTADPTTTTTWQYAYGADDRLTTVCSPLSRTACWSYDYDSTSQHANTVLNAGPTSYWPFNETGGTVANSAVLSNAGVDAARYANVELGQPGGLAGSTATAAGFNGTNSYVQLPGDLIGDGQYQSVSMWFKTTTPGGVLLSYNSDPITRGSTTGDYTPALYIDKNGRMRGEFYIGNASLAINSNVVVTDGLWHHVALAGAGDSQTLYVDGQVRGALAGTIVAPDYTSFANINIGAGFVGGGWPDHVKTGAAATATYFKGAISDVAFYNETLDVSTVEALRGSGVTAHPVLSKVTRPSGGVTAAVGYDKRTGKVATVTDENNGTWTMGTPQVLGSSDVYVASVLGGKPNDYWRLAESGTSAAVNEVAGGAAGYTDVTLGATNGPFADAKAATFNGTSSYLTLPPQDVPTTGPTSIEMWFRQPKDNAAGGVLYGYQSMGMDDVDAGGDWVPALYVGTDGKLRGSLWSNNFANIMTTGGRVNDGLWHHVVLSASPTSQTLFLDGGVVDTKAATMAATIATTAYIGAGKWSGAWPGHSNATAGYFSGAIAEVAVFDSALSADQVIAHRTAFLQTAPVAITMVAGVAQAIAMPVSRFAVTGPSGEQLSYSYDLVNGNRMVVQADALGNETKFGYDVGGFGSLVYDARGVWTQNLQDARGNTKQTITCQHQAAGKCSSVYYTYYPDATTTALTPDARNDLLLDIRDGRSVDATDNSFRTTYAYDVKGNRTAVTDPLGQVTRSTFTDGTTPAVGGGVVPAGLPTTVTTPGGTRQTVRYYATGDIAELTDPVGKKVAYSYDGLGRPLTEKEITDSYPNGLLTTHTYDALGREVTETDPAVTNRVTGAVHTSRTTTGYDDDNNVLSVTEEDLTGGDSSRTETHTYNALGQERTGITASGAKSSYTYDAYGRVVSETGPDGDVTRNAYDLEGNLLTSTVVGFTGDPDDPQPARDLLISAKSYDPAGRLATEVDAMGWTTSYTYTDNGLEETTTRSDGKTSFVVEDNTYDAAGNVIATLSNDRATRVEMTYDAAGRMTSTTADPAGLKRSTTPTYDRDGNVVATTQRDAAGTILGRTESMYDDDGKVLAETTYPSDDLTPVDRWKLDETAGAKAADSAGNNPATLGAGATWSTEHGGSVTLNGTGALTATGPAVDTTRSYTVSAWAKLDDKDRSRTIVAQAGDRTSAFLLQYQKAKDRWSLLLPGTDADDWQGRNVYSSSVPQIGDWTQLTGVYDASTGKAMLYVNGTLEDTATVGAGWAAHGALTIGRAWDVGEEADPWSGGISDVQVYQQALDAGEVARVSAGTAPAADATVIRTRYTYDNDGQLVAATDPNGNTTYYAYDEAGQQSKTTAPAAVAESSGTAPITANAVSFTGYNTFGEQTDTKDPNGNWSVTTYDAEGRPVVERSPRYRAPGADEAITPEITRSYDPSGRLASVRDPLGKETSYVYDQLDRLSSVRTANGAVTRYSYDLLGDLESTTDPNGAVSKATWDYLGRQQTSTEVVRQNNAGYTTSYAYGRGGWQTGVTTPGKVTTSTAYNALGETTSVTDGANNTTAYDYDGVGRVTRVTLPDKTYSASTYDLAGRTLKQSSHRADGTELQSTSSRYDRAGNVVASIDGRKTVTRFGYDATGMLVREVQPISASDSIETTFGYDLTGNRTRFTDGRGNTFWTTYNTLGLPESQIEPSTTSATDPADRTFTTAYDAAGRAVRQDLPGGVSITNSYDEVGQLRHQSGSGAEAATEDRDFTYDRGGRLTSFSGPGGQNTVDYDDRDLPTSMSGPSGDATFAYNPDGALAARTDAAGTTSFGYDGAGRLATLANTSAGVQEAFTYNTLSAVTRMTFGTSGNSRNFTYDDLHRLTGDELKTSTGASVASVRYSWDANDNLIAKSTTGFAGSAENSYTYDLADRLTSWNNGTAITAYAYDKSGNRVQNGNKLFSYDARNRLLSADGVGYSYTARGTLKTAGADRTESDAFGQVVSQQAGNGFQSYEYDALGRAVKPHFAYSTLDNDLAADGTATYVRGTAGEVVGESAGGVNRLTWTDLHSDVIGQFTADGTALSGSTTFDPLGKAVATTGILGNLGYQSEWSEQSTGRVNMHARWFNTDTGQFDTRDTASNSPAPDSVNANRYQYGDANPLTVMDPTGHWGFSFKSIARSVSRAVSTSVSRVSSYASSFASSAYSFAQSTYRAAKSTVKAAVTQVKRAYTKVKKAVSKQYHRAEKWVKKKVQQGRKWVAQKVAKVKKAVKKTVAFAKQAGQKVKAAAARVAKNPVAAVKDAASATKKFVVEHKDAILEVAAIGGAILAGMACTAASLGSAVVACMVGTGALINLAKDMAQGNIHSLGDALGSVGTGAMSGLLGGAGGAVAARVGAAVAKKVGTGLVGRLATEAAENGIDEVFNQAVTTGRVDVKSAILGMIPGLGRLAGKGKSSGNHPGFGGSRAPSTRGSAGARPATVKTFDAPDGDWSIESRRADAQMALDDTIKGNQAHGPQRLNRAWSAGINIDTGKIAVACSGNGHCAEGNVVNALGGDSSRVVFTKSQKVDSRDPLKTTEKAICRKCEDDYLRSQFPGGTRFESDEDD